MTIQTDQIHLNDYRENRAASANPSEYVTHAGQILLEKFELDLDTLRQTMPALPREDSYYEAFDEFALRVEADFSNQHVDMSGHHLTSLEDYLLGLYMHDRQIGVVALCELAELQRRTAEEVK